MLSKKGIMGTQKTKLGTWRTLRWSHSIKRTKKEAKEGGKEGRREREIKEEEKGGRKGKVTVTRKMWADGFHL